MGGKRGPFQFEVSEKSEPIRNDRGGYTAAGALLCGWELDEDILFMRLLGFCGSLPIIPRSVSICVVMMRWYSSTSPDNVPRVQPASHQQQGPTR